MAHLSFCSSLDDTMTNYPHCDCGESPAPLPARALSPVERLRNGGQEDLAAAVELALSFAYADGRKDEREECERICAAEQAENRELAKGSKTAMYDWMADGAGLCLGAIRARSCGEKV